jgi:spermidine/putrescine transport system substrate-binding protein
MIRSLSGPYKQGRSTEAEGYLLKVKRFEDGEARIQEYYEEMENQNAEFTNELGRTARSSHKAGMVGKNRLGGFHVTGVGGRYDGVYFDIASGAMSHEMRSKLWETRDLIGKLVLANLIRPLQHSYIENISNVFAEFTNPWYDQEWRYTTPYSVYTTGIGWNNTVVPADIGALKNPYEALWDPAYKNKTAVIDDWHTAMSMVLLKLGITDVNTSSADNLKQVGEQLTALVAATSPKVTITMYTDVPTGQIGLTQMWSGDIINAQNYLPEGVTADVLRYWFPTDGKGLVDNDLMVILRGGKNPVLSHLFINHMLETESAKQNFKQIGYQPPQVSMSPDSLVADGFVAENIKTAIVRPEYYDVGYRILELEPDNDAAWHNVWRAFKAGGS